MLVMGTMATAYDPWSFNVRVTALGGQSSLARYRIPSLVPPRTNCRCVGGFFPSCHVCWLLQAAANKESGCDEGYKPPDESRMSTETEYGVRVLRRRLQATAAACRSVSRPTNENSVGPAEASQLVSLNISRIGQRSIRSATSPDLANQPLSTPSASASASTSTSTRAHTRVHTACIRHPRAIEKEKPAP